MSTVAEVTGVALQIAGAAFAVTAGLGLHKFPDVFARMHAASKPATLGAVLVLGGSALRIGNEEAAGILVLVLAAQLLTAPLGAHMIGRAIYRSGTELAETTVLDELARAGLDAEGREDDR